MNSFIELFWSKKEELWTSKVLLVQLLRLSIKGMPNEILGTKVPSIISRWI